MLVLDSPAPLDLRLLVSQCTSNACTSVTWIGLRESSYRSDSSWTQRGNRVESRYVRLERRSVCDVN